MSSCVPTSQPFSNFLHHLPHCELCASEATHSEDFMGLHCLLKMHSIPHANLSSNFMRKSICVSLPWHVAPSTTLQPSPFQLLIHLLFAIVSFICCINCTLFLSTPQSCIQPLIRPRGTAAHPLARPSGPLAWALYCGVPPRLSLRSCHVL